MLNPDFYPTPEALAHRMFDKVNFSNVNTILEPSAGMGDLIEALDSHTIKVPNSANGYYRARHNPYEIDAIEIESDFQAILSKLPKVAVVDSDFLSYTGATHYDLIMANFPFSDGEKHLHKALDILFCGQIVCLLNAETIKNPCTKSRQDLVVRLRKLNADIEYIQNAFINAERKTDVEIALIYVKVERSVEIDVFGEMKDSDTAEVDFKENEMHDVSTKETYHDLEAKYNQTCEQVSQQLVAFYGNYKNVSKYLDLQIVDDKGYYRDSNSLTDLMRKKHNSFIKRIKKEYWEKVTDLPEVKKYLTSTERDKLSKNSSVFHCKEFTASNIRQFVLNLVKSYPEHINQAIEDLFDKMTSYALKDQTWGWEECKNNILHFNAWKTNSGYKINKKVILPFYRDTYSQKYNDLSWSQEQFLDDMEKVMHYFDPARYYSSFEDPDSPRPLSMGQICKRWLQAGENRKIETAYFFVSIFKKGTIHLEFKDEDLLRRFNIEACKMKNFIPKEYSDKEYNDLSDEEREIVNQFEGKAAYKPVRENVRLFGNSSILALEHKLD